jgi:predicted Zn-ribbon and HTH transcriptional regulator
VSKHLLTIARFGTPFQANMAKNRLEAEGIPAFLADEQMVGNFLAYGPVLGGVKLLVPDDYLQKAMDVLTKPPEDELYDEESDLSHDQNHEQTEAIQAIRTCPQCGNKLSAEQRFCPACTSLQKEANKFMTEGESLGSADQDAGEDVPVLPQGDDLAFRAWKTAAFGLIFFPLTFYSSWLLVRLLLFPAQLSAEGKRKGLGALAFDAVVLILLYVVILTLGKDSH